MADANSPLPAAPSPPCPLIHPQTNEATMAHLGIFYANESVKTPNRRGQEGRNEYPNQKKTKKSHEIERGLEMCVIDHR